MHKRRTRKWGWATLAVITAAATSLAACSSGTGTGDASASAVSQDQVQAALKAGGDLKIWGWDATLPATVAAFEKTYPKVHVTLTNVGTGNDEYSALQNAVTAGSGVPDVVHMEYSAVPQFALSHSLSDLTAFGAGALKANYTPGTWASVAKDGGIYGLPLDSGPMALFYNKTVFDKFGIAVPKTWDEYVADARAIHKADPTVYLAGDTGDAGFTMSMIWQAGGTPFQVKGSNVTVNLADKGSTRFTTMWQTMIDGGLVAPITTWSDEWYKALGNGTIASLTIGAWMPAMLESGVPSGSGQWRVAPMPQWKSGADQTAENGGSALVVTKASKAQNLAYGFVKFSNAGDGVHVRLDQGTFPATTADLASSAFLSKEFPFFGGQKVNQVLADSAAHVLPGWSYLPFQPYATSIFNDYVGKAYVSKTTLADGLKAWQNAIVKYGTDQGFSVKAG